MLIPNTPVIAARPGRKKDLPGQGLLFSLEDQDSPAKPVPVKAAPNPLAAMSDRWSPRIEIVRFAVENNRDRIESLEPTDRAGFRDLFELFNWDLPARVAQSLENCFWRTEAWWSACWLADTLDHHSASAAIQTLQRKISMCKDDWYHATITGRPMFGEFPRCVPFVSGSTLRVNPGHLSFWRTGRPEAITLIWEDSRHV